MGHSIMKSKDVNLVKDLNTLLIKENSVKLAPREQHAMARLEPSKASLDPFGGLKGTE